MFFSSRESGLRCCTGEAFYNRLLSPGRVGGIWCTCSFALVLTIGVAGCSLFEDAPDASKAITVSELLVDTDEDGEPDLLNDVVVVKGLIDRVEEDDNGTIYLSGHSRSIPITSNAFPEEDDSLVVEGTLVRENGRLVFHVTTSAALRGPDAVEAETAAQRDQEAEKPDSSTVGLARAIDSDLQHGLGSIRSMSASKLPILFVVLLVIGGMPVLLRIRKLRMKWSTSSNRGFGFQEAGEAMLITNARFDVLEANPAALKLLGWTAGDARRYNLAAFLKLPTDEDASDRSQNAGSVLLDVDVSVTLGGGASRELQVRVTRLEGSGQNRLLCLLIDNTERRERDRLMQRLQQAMLDEMPLEVAILSPQGQYVFASAGLVGDEKARKAIIGKTDVEICREAGFHSEVAIRRRAQRRLTVASKQIVTFDETLTMPEGERHFVRHYIPVLNSRGDVSAIIAYGIEVSELRRLQRELAVLTEENTRLHRMKDSFLQNLSHEFRTPLTGILGAIQVLRDEVSPAQRELLDIALRNGNRLQKTLGDILDLADLQASELQVNLVVLNVVEEVRGVVAEMQKAAKDKGLFLRIHETQQEIWARLDTACFRRVLSHLLENAIKFTDAGGIVVDVDVDEKHVHVRVMDSGVGIDDQYLTTLYEEFSQESTGLSRNFEGLGIGLAITERLIGMMGGSIMAHSEKADGSMFSITLPRALAWTNSTKEDLPAILILERDRDEQRIFQYMLEPFCRVSFVTDPESIIDWLSEERCDGVLLNLDLCSDPAHLVSRIRALSGASGVLLVGMSTHNLTGGREYVLAQGFDEYVSKPVSKQALFNTLGSMLALNQVQ